MNPSPSHVLIWSPPCDARNGEHSAGRRHGTTRGRSATNRIEQREISRFGNNQKNDVDKDQHERADPDPLMDLEDVSDAQRLRERLNSGNTRDGISEE